MEHGKYSESKRQNKLLKLALAKLQKDFKKSEIFLTESDRVFEKVSVSKLESRAGSITRPFTQNVKFE